MHVSWTKDRRFSGRYPLKHDRRRRNRDGERDSARQVKHLAGDRSEPASRSIGAFGQRNPADYRKLSREDRRENLYFGIGMLIFFGAIAATAITLYVFVAVNAALFGAG